jgi:N-acetyl-gamma-glutamyl-phosphate reductase
MKVAILGAAGYAGQVLAQLAMAHPSLDLVAVQGHEAAGELLGSIVPSLVHGEGDLVVEPIGSDVAGAETVFLALPHGLSQEFVPRLLVQHRVVVDLGADFRFADPTEYAKWYGDSHGAPELLEQRVYGLVETQRSQLKGAQFIAAPGCYVTAASLGLWPLVSGSFIGEELVIVDAYSGVSGAGKGLKATSQFVSVNENLSAYGLLNHRHTGEMEMNLGRTVLFTPHLAPITRGILATSYAVPAAGAAPLDQAQLLAHYRQVYADSPFVRVVDRPPGTREVVGTNYIAIYPTYDPRTDRYLVISVIDNLIKGAGGQAIQALNVAMGWPEDLGLTQLGVWP